MAGTENTIMYSVFRLCIANALQSWRQKCRVTVKALGRIFLNKKDVLWTSKRRSRFLPHSPVCNFGAVCLAPTYLVDVIYVLGCFRKCIFLRIRLPFFILCRNIIKGLEKYKLFEGPVTPSPKNVLYLYRKIRYNVRKILFDFRSIFDSKTSGVS